MPSRLVRHRPLITGLLGHFVTVLQRVEEYMRHVFQAVRFGSTYGRRNAFGHTGPGAINARRSVLVVVIAMQCVPVCTVEVVDVILVCDGFMPATVAVGVVVNLGGDVGVHRVLVVVIPVQVMRMPVMEVVDVAIMLHRDVAAGRPVVVVMVGVYRVGGHEIASFLRPNLIVTCAYIYVKLRSWGSVLPGESRADRHRANGTLGW